VRAAHCRQPLRAFAPQVRRKEASQARRASGAQRYFRRYRPRMAQGAATAQGAVNIETDIGRRGFSIDMGGWRGYT